MKALLIGVLVVFFMVAPALSMAQASGPVVGRNCTASWGAVSTDTTGAALPAGTVVTYNFYLSSSSTPPSTPSQGGLSGLSTQPCSSLSPGQQYTAWVSAVASFNGSASESALSSPFPFVLALPASPTGITVR